MNFDQKTTEQLQAYVYALLDGDGAPFYIGKGNRNRVFDHVACALDQETESDKYDKIREIKSSGSEVQHLILRHGMTDKVAFEVESALIDMIGHLDFPLTNQMLGHHAIDSGLMTSEEVIRKYNAEDLTELSDPVIIININKTYERGSGERGIYEATRTSWVIAKQRMETVKYALSEYRGLIVEVFEIADWYPVDVKDRSGKPKTRWAFTGKVADALVREKYINKSVANSKQQGAANPIRYRL